MTSWNPGSVRRTMASVGACARVPALLDAPAGPRRGRPDSTGRHHPYRHSAGASPGNRDDRPCRTSIGVGREDLAAVDRAERPPGDAVDRALHEPDAAVAEQG